MADTCDTLQFFLMEGKTVAVYSDNETHVIRSNPAPFLLRGRLWIRRG